MSSAPKMAVGTDAVAWAMEHGAGYSYRGRSNAFPEHDRRAEYVRGMVWSYQDARGSKDGSPCGAAQRAILDGRGQFADATEALYVVDFGDHVTAYYVAAWHPEQDYLILADVAQLTEGHYLAPRKVYHLQAK